MNKEDLSHISLSINKINENPTIIESLAINILNKNVDCLKNFKDSDEVYIESYIDYNNLVLIITNLNSKYLEKSNTYFDNKINKIMQFEKYNNMHSNLYMFNNIEDVKHCSEIIASTHSYFKKNSLYRYNDLYFLIFSKSSTKNINFKSTHLVLNEFSLNHIRTDILNISIEEKGECLIKNSAIQELISN